MHSRYRPSSPYGDFLTLFGHVVFGLVVGNLCRRRGLLAILGLVVCVLVVGVFILGVAIGAGCHGCEFLLQVPGTQTGDLRKCRGSSLSVRWSSQAAK